MPSTVAYLKTLRSWWPEPIIKRQTFNPLRHPGATAQFLPKLLLTLPYYLCSPQVSLPSDIIQHYYNNINYIPFAVCLVPATYSLCNCASNSPSAVMPIPRPLPSGNHQFVLSIYVRFCLKSSLFRIGDLNDGWGLIC